MLNFRIFLLISLINLIILPPFSSFAEPKKSRDKIVPQPIQELFQSNLVYPQEKDEIQFTLFPSFRKNQMPGKNLVLELLSDRKDPTFIKKMLKFIYFQMEVLVLLPKKFQIWSLIRMVVCLIPNFLKIYDLSDIWHKV